MGSTREKRAFAFLATAAEKHWPPQVYLRRFPDDETMSPELRPSFIEFQIKLPSVTATGIWRERARMGRGPAY